MKNNILIKAIDLIDDDLVERALLKSNKSIETKPYNFIVAAALFAAVMAVVFTAGRINNSPAIMPQGNTTENITDNSVITQPGTETTDMKETTSMPLNIGNDDMYCNHIWEYHSIDKLLTDYVEEKAPGWSDKFIDMFGRTEDCNIRFFADYFGLSVDECFEDIIGYDTIDFIIENNKNSNYKEYFNAEKWSSDNYATDEYFLVKKPAPDDGSVMIRPNGDTIHTDRYFTIHKSLIDFVGEDDFNIFKTVYGGTDKFNILYFIEFFSISRSDFEKCMEKAETEQAGRKNPWPNSQYIYNLNYVYGTEEQQKQYFEKHILEN